MTRPQRVNPPVYINGGTLEKTAIDILSRHGMGNELPIDIEHLCDLMGVKILLLPNLYKDFSVDAYITDDCSVLVVDEYAFFNYEHRARFSIAHELSHHILHKDFLAQFDIKDIGSYLKFQDAINSEMRKTIEIQAYILAGYLLMPTDKLKREVTNIVGPIDKQIININQLAQVIEAVQPKFGVSTLALSKQLSRVFPEFDAIISSITE